MKKLFLLFTMLMSGNMLFAQTSCSTYYPFDEGTTFQITSYSKNDKEAAVIDYVVKESNGEAATLAYKMYDDKGKLIVESEYDIFCEAEGISIDFNSLAAPGVLEQYKDMEVDISGSNLIWPNNLSAGQTLPDANILMNIKMPPVNMKMTVDILNRKVEGMETVTTPAGTFECFVISYTHESRMGMKITGNAKDWIAKGVGMVKSESYNKKGKRNSRSELTAFSD